MGMAMQRTLMNEVMGAMMEERKGMMQKAIKELAEQKWMDMAAMVDDHGDNMQEKHMMMMSQMSDRDGTCMMRMQMMELMGKMKGNKHEMAKALMDNMNDEAKDAMAGELREHMMNKMRETFEE